MKLYNAETLIAEKIANCHATRATIFSGDSEYNRVAKSPEILMDFIVPAKSANWVGSEGYHRLWQEIGELHHRLNAAQPPADSVITDLLGKLFIDITRRAMESPDYTGLIAKEETNFEFNETVNLREIWPYRGEFKTISGTNDSVPLIEQAFGETDTVDMEIKAIGWKTSLANLLYNKLHTLEKVTTAVADADVDSRNKVVIGSIVGATYAASQKQAADTTSGATYDILMYNTFRKAIKKLYSLKDYRTERPIAVHSIAVLCNPQDAWSIMRVIGGQLQSGGTTGVITTINASALPISQIIEYQSGRNHGFSWGKHTLSYPGVTAGKCYIFVPREYFLVLNKRPLTVSTGRGSVLQLSQEEKAWYRVNSSFSKLFFGSSYAGTSLGAGYGAVIEVTLPADA